MSTKKSIERHTRSALPVIDFNAHTAPTEVSHKTMTTVKPVALDFRKLESSNESENVAGIQEVTAFFKRDVHGSKNPFGAVDTLRLNSFVMSALESESEVLHQYLMDSGLLNTLVSFQIVVMTDILGPLLELNVRSQNASIKGWIQKHVETVKSEYSSTELLQTLALSIRNTAGPTAKGRPKTSARWIASVNECILEWLVQIMQNGIEDDYFEKYANLQACMVKLVPLLSAKSSTPALKSLIFRALEILYSNNTDGFQRSLQTFDVDLTHIIYTHFGTVESEEEENIEIEQIALVEPQDQTFLEAGDLDEKSNVFDVRLLCEIIYII